MIEKNFLTLYFTKFHDGTNFLSNFSQTQVRWFEIYQEIDVLYPIAKVVLVSYRNTVPSNFGNSSFVSLSSGGKAETRLEEKFEEGQKIS